MANERNWRPKRCQQEGFTQVAVTKDGAIKHHTTKIHQKVKGVMRDEAEPAFMGISVSD